MLVTNSPAQVRCWVILVCYTEKRKGIPWPGVESVIQSVVVFFFFPFWMMTLFMDNQYYRLLLATINPQEPSLIIYPPHPQRPIHFNIVYQGQGYNTQGKLFFPTAQYWLFRLILYKGSWANSVG